MMEETKRRNQQGRTSKTTRKQVIKWQLSKYLAIITLNVKRLSAPNKTR